MQTFSAQLDTWLHSKQPKTIRSLSELFGEKSFAIIVVVLMFLPALPIPTGGITHVFELIVMLLALELMIGRRNIWLPKRWQDMPLGKTWQNRIIPKIVKRLRWFERFARPRLSGVMNNTIILRLVGLIFLIFTLGAFVAPPFAGLDTLPSMGVVVIGLALLFEDILLFAIGYLLGAIGVGIIIGTGGLTLHFLTRLFHLF